MLSRYEKNPLPVLLHSGRGSSVTACRPTGLPLSAWTTTWT